MRDSVAWEECDVEEIERNVRADGVFSNPESLCTRLLIMGSFSRMGTVVAAASRDALSASSRFWCSTISASSALIRLSAGSSAPWMNLMLFAVDRFERSVSITLLAAVRGNPDRWVDCHELLNVDRLDIAVSVPER